jgi:hypothetical protein
MKSIYIPRMNVHHDESYVKIVLQNNYKFGVVNRVDFTTINKKPGFSENMTNNYKSAFVHFDCIWNKPYLYSKDGKKFWDAIENETPYKVHLEKNEFEKGKNEYWICLKNKNPVKSTLMNIHQVVENSRYLENLIEEQGNQIEEQDKKIAEQGKQIANLQIMLEALLTMDKKIFYEEEENDNQDNESLDENLCLRKRLQNMKISENTNNYYYNHNAKRKYDDYLSVSTHSSILPELEEDNFEGDEYFETSTTSEETISERIKNSCDLCGNE